MEYITKIDEIITDKTKVVFLKESSNKLIFGHTTKSSFSKELDSFVYYKPFSLEEYIGEYIAKYLGLKTVENFIVDVRSKHFISSKSFIDKNKKYITPRDFINTGYLLNVNKLDKIFSLLKKYDDLEKLIQDFFKMIALDIYMRQEDRNFENYLFELYNNSISLGPLYDYTIAFDYYNNDLPYFYYNDFVILEKKEDYEELYEFYPFFRTYIEKVKKIDLIELIKKIFEENYFRINDKIVENYKKEEEKTQKLLQKIL